MRGTKILIAPNSFKGGLDAWTLAPLMERGVFFAGRVKNIPISTRQIPIADGGTGFRRVITQTDCAVEIDILHPHSGSTKAKIGLLGSDVAVIESAEFIGLALLKNDQKNPLFTTSYPLGQAISWAIQSGRRRILIGGGDSATCDGGVGLLAALGARIIDNSGKVIEVPKACDLERIARIDVTDSLITKYDGAIEIACNLTSLAAGKSGTARVYAQQKGATKEQAERLACDIDRYATILHSASSRQDQSRLPGSGSAGGISLPLMALAKNCRPRYSFEVTFEALEIERHLNWADIVITGEGAFDKNSIKGKAPVALAQKAKLFDCQTLAVVGSIEMGVFSKAIRSGLDVIEPITNLKIDLESYMTNARQLVLEATARGLMKMLHHG